jgi:two-component system chemotaxis response regulator CheB
MTQHMPAGFTSSFVTRLNSLCAMRVQEARDDEPLQPGCAYLAPGGVAHLAVRRVGGQLRTQLIDSEPVNRHRPSVDVLFESVALTMGNRATGILLTGMGRDGARGLLAMREKGADTFVQDETTSVVFGMPREALALGAATEAIALERIAQRLMSGPHSKVTT